MKLWWHLLHGWLGHAAGSVVCRWKNDHVESHETGVVGGVFEPYAARVYWERTYCTRCGVTLKEKFTR